MIGALAGSFIAAVLLLAGIGKLLEPDATGAAIRNFGIMRKPRRLHARLFAIAELSVAALLLAPGLPLLHIGLWLAAGLFLLFSALQFRVLVRGERFPCGCFGNPASEVSPWTMMRSAGLFALSTAASALTSPGTLPYDSRLYSSAALLVFLASLSAIAAHVSRNRHRTSAA